MKYKILIVSLLTLSMICVAVLGTQFLKPVNAEVMKNQVKYDVRANATQLPIGMMTSDGTKYYLKIDGIQGDVMDKVCDKCIEVSNYGFGASNYTDPMGGGGSTGKVMLSEMYLSKLLDKSSPLLFKNLVEGKIIQQVQLLAFKPAKDGKRTEFMHYKLDNVMISSINHNGNQGNTPMESISFNFDKLQFDVGGVSYQYK